MPFYLVSTPIGNLTDITSRAIDTLKSADYIVCEDTRETGKLLSLLEIPKKQLISYRDQIHEKVFPNILGLVTSGANVVLVSDRGTPTISDPGYKIVRDLLKNNIQALSVPGVSAVIAALSISGLPTDRFTFLGFLPRKTGQQNKILDKFKNSDTTLIIYESPFRVISTLENLVQGFPDSEISIVKEITKSHEQVLTAPASDILDKVTKLTLKGEFVILVR